MNRYKLILKKVKVNSNALINLGGVLNSYILRTVFGMGVPHFPSRDLKA